MIISQYVFAVFSMAAFSVAELTYPAIMEVDLVFPRNGTYNNITDFPVVFAVQNAEAAFRWGGTLSWQITRATKYGPSIVALRTLTTDRGVPPDAVNNIWFAATKPYNTTILTPGEYQLSWTWKMLTCSETNNRVTYIYGGTSAAGNISFTLVGSGGEKMDLTQDCPIFQRRVVAGRATSGGCPIMVSTEEIQKQSPEPCKAKVSADMAACITANLTNSGDTSACQKVIKNGGSNGGSGGDAKEGSASFVRTSLAVLVVGILAAINLI